MHEDPNPYTPIDENRRRPLTLAQLADANRRRAVEWNPAGTPLGLEFAMVELAGEVGEACNALKKIIRHKHGLKGGDADTSALANELGDAQICLSLVANAAGIDLGEATRAKFNKTSEKHGFSTRL